MKGTIYRGDFIDVNSAHLREQLCPVQEHRHCRLLPGDISIIKINIKK